jgi:hypothetical protein
VQKQKKLFYTVGFLLGKLKKERITVYQPREKLLRWESSVEREIYQAKVADRLDAVVVYRAHNRQRTALKLDLFSVDGLPPHTARDELYLYKIVPMALGHSLDTPDKGLDAGYFVYLVFR